MAVLAPPVVGYIADLLGLRGTLLRWLSVGACFTYGVFALAADAGSAPSFAFTFVCIALFALFRSPLGMLADVIALEEGSDYGRTRLWGSLGFLVSALIAGLWISTPDSRVVPLGTALLFVLVLAASFVLPPRARLPPSPVKEEARLLVHSRPFLLFLMASFLSQAAHSAYDLCCGLMFQDLGGSSFFVGGAWAVAVIAEVSMLACSPWLLSRWHPLSLRSVAYAGAAVRWLLMANTQSLPTLLVLQLAHAVSFALMWLSSIALVRELSLPHTLATAQGLFVAATASGGVLGAITWGQLYRHNGSAVVFTCAALISIAALTVNLLTPKTRAMVPLSVE
jgi:PPP family 3-phenylpropionic acid transporter